MNSVRISTLCFDGVRYFIQALCQMFLLHIKGAVRMKKKKQEAKRRKYEKKKCLIYEMMTGNIRFNSPLIKKRFYVRDEFREGMICEKAYADIYDANRRICKKLNAEEDTDVECIINSYIEITRYLCYKMYDYGAFFGKIKKSGN